MLCCHLINFFFKFLQEKDISRINKYGTQADCVAHKNELSYLRKYCYCLKAGTGPDKIKVMNPNVKLGHDL